MHAVPASLPRCLLAFDTSTERLCAAAAAGDRRATVDAPSAAAASSTLLPQLRALLGQVDRDWADVDAIAFGAGPGAFTGLRTACAVAQGLAFGLGLPVIAVDSLLVVADDALEQAAVSNRDGDVAVAIDARIGEVYAARYRRADGRWRVVDAPALLDPVAWARSLCSGAPPDAVAGSALALFGDRLTLPPVPRFASAADRAAALLRLALQAAAEGAAVDAAAALPRYLRDRVAETTAERAARRDAAKAAAEARS